MWISNWWRSCPSYSHVLSYTDLIQSDIIEPVTLQECKDYMRLEGWAGEDSPSTEFSFDDDLISELIAGARQYVEQCANVSLVPHEYEVVLTNAGRIELPFSPIADVGSIVDSDENPIDDNNIKVIGNDRKYLVSPVGQDLTVTYTTSALKDWRPMTDIKILVWAMYNQHTKDPVEVISQINLWIDSYSRKSVVA